MNKSVYEQLNSATKIFPAIELDQVAALRRCAMTLHRWAELECGDSNSYASWRITRDNATGKPFMERVPHVLGTGGKRTLTPIADREKGALKRAKAISDALGAELLHQGDPRGAALGIAKDGREVWFYK